MIFERSAIYERFLNPDQVPDRTKSSQLGPVRKLVRIFSMIINDPDSFKNFFFEFSAVWKSGPKSGPVRIIRPGADFRTEFRTTYRTKKNPDQNPDHVPDQLKIRTTYRTGPIRTGSPVVQKFCTTYLFVKILKDSPVILTSTKRSILNYLLLSFFVFFR